MDKEFLAEIKAAALAAGWEETEEHAMWVFPDGTGIASKDWAGIHGTLAFSVGLISRQEYQEASYDAIIHTLLSFGLVRRRGSYTYQTWDTSGYGIINKYALRAGDRSFTLDVVARNESYYPVDFDDNGWDVGKAVGIARRDGSVQQYARGEVEVI